jgi:hypothetical protein
MATLTDSGVAYSDGTQTTAGSTSNASNGYQRFPGGVLIQWGRTATTTWPANAAGSQAVSFPVAFSSVHKIYCNFYGGTTGELWARQLGALSVTTSGFTAYSSSMNNGQNSMTNSGVMWWAIGN